MSIYQYFQYIYIYPTYPTGWWFGTFLYIFYFPYIGMIILTDELIFFRGVAQPATRVG